MVLLRKWPIISFDGNIMLSTTLNLRAEEQNLSDQLLAFYKWLLFFLHTNTKICAPCEHPHNLITKELKRKCEHML